MGPRPLDPEASERLGRTVFKSIERIDPDGDYEPANCRWATATEQRVNQR